MISKEKLEEIKAGIDHRGANAAVLERLIDALIDESENDELFEARIPVSVLNVGEA